MKKQPPTAFSPPKLVSKKSRTRLVHKAPIPYHGGRLGQTAEGRPGAKRVRIPPNRKPGQAEESNPGVRSKRLGHKGCG